MTGRTLFEPAFRLVALTLAAVVALLAVPVVHAHQSEAVGLYSAECALAELATRTAAPALLEHTESPEPAPVTTAVPVQRPLDRQATLLFSVRPRSPPPR